MSINSKAKFWGGEMDAERASKVWAASLGWLRMPQGTGCLVPHSQVLLPCLSFSL